MIDSEMVLQCKEFPAGNDGHGQRLLYNWINVYKRECYLSQQTLQNW